MFLYSRMPMHLGNFFVRGHNIRIEVRANNPLLQSRRQTLLRRLSACTEEVYCFCSVARQGKIDSISNLVMCQVDF